MTAGEFAKIVAEMRAYQVRYFKTRNTLYQKKAIALERLVDDLLEDRGLTHKLEEPASQTNQKELF
jgi:hypothetical protein